MRYPQPDNEDEFEDFCLRFYRKHLDRQNLKRYGKRGESQDGVDIFDPLCLKPASAVQCKHHEPHKTLPPQKIKDEVAKAEKFPHPLSHYIIATTAKKTKNAQNCVATLNRRKNKKFTVEIHFWEDICELLSQFHRVQAEIIVYGQSILAGAMEQIPRAHQIAPLVEELLKDRRLDAAKHEVEKLEALNSTGNLSLEDQYRYLRLKGKVAVENGQYSEAGTCFLSAFDKSPDSDEAKQNRVYGVFLQGKPNDAHDLAKQYFDNGLRNAVMASHLVHTADSVEDVDAYLAEIETLAKSDDNLCIALAYKFSADKQYEKARKFTDRALEIDSESPYAYLADACIAHEEAIYGAWRARRSNLELALKQYTTAIDLATERDYPNLLPESFTHRGVVNFLLDNLDAAVSDYQKAAACETQSGGYVARAASFFLHARMYEEAWKLRDKLDLDTLEGKFLAVGVEYHNSDSETKRQCIKQMLQLANQEWERSLECRFHAVQWAIGIHDYELGRTCVSDEFQKSHPLQAHTLLAWIYQVTNEIDKAKQETSFALEQSTESVHRQELELLASLLFELEQFPEAAMIFEQVVTPGVFDDSMKQYLTCAQHLERHDWLLRICVELRESEAQDDKVRKLELQVLSEYLPQDAFELAGQHIETADDPRFFVAFRNFLAVRLDRSDQLDLDPDNLPKPSDIEPIEAAIVTIPYIAGDKFDLVLEFLYEQLRLNFDSEHAHAQYIFFVLQHGQYTGLGVAPTRVAKDTAVLLKKTGKSDQWITFENDRPKASRGEFASDSPIGKTLLSHAVGDQIELPGVFQKETAEVAELQTKQLRAFQDSIGNFRKRFPDTSLLQEFSGFKDDGQLNIEPLVSSLEKRRDHIDYCIRAYRDENLTIHFLSSQLGFDIPQALQALADHPDGYVKCSRTTPQEFHQLSEKGLQHSAILFELTAIATCWHADVWEDMPIVDRMIVAQSTVEEVDQWIDRAKRDKTSSYMNLGEDGKLVMTEISDEEKQSRVDGLQKMRDWIASNCHVQSSSSSAGIDPERRKLYRVAIGFHGLDSICIASDLGIPIWTDDAVLGLIGKADFGVDSVWTQLVLSQQVFAENCDQKNFDRYTAKLASWDYTQLIWHASTVVAAAKESEWDPNLWPLKQCLSLITNTNHPPVQRALIVTDALKLLRQSDCPDLLQSRVVQALLDALNDPAGAGWILRQLDSIFRVDPFSAAAIETEIRYWLRLR